MRFETTVPSPPPLLTQEVCVKEGGRQNTRPPWAALAPGTPLVCTKECLGSKKFFWNWYLHSKILYLFYER